MLEPIWSPGPHRLSGIMAVTGFILGSIRSQSDVMRGGVVPGGWAAKLGWGGGEGNHVPSMLWRLLVADRTEQGFRPPLWYKRACLYGLADGRVSDIAGNIQTVIPKDREISDLTAMYFKRAQSVVWGRRIIELGSNLLVAESTEQLSRIPELVLYGLGPEGSEKGASLVALCAFILYGCSVPVVLRSSGSALYEVVGEAYVHGAMDGEFMTEDWQSRAREFRLA